MRLYQKYYKVLKTAGQESRTQNYESLFFVSSQNETSAECCSTCVSSLGVHSQLLSQLGSSWITKSPLNKDNYRLMWKILLFKPPNLQTMAPRAVSLLFIIQNRLLRFSSTTTSILEKEPLVALCKTEQPS